MENNENNIPSTYKPLSPWAYFGYNILFTIPLVGFICAIIFAFDNSNINRRNYARSFFCGLALLVIFVITIVVLFGIFGAQYYALNTIGTMM